MWYPLMVKKPANGGYIDTTTGKVIVPFEHDSAECFDYANENSFAIVGKDGKRGLIATTGKVIVPIEDDDFRIDENLVYLSKDGKWGLLEILYQRYGAFAVGYLSSSNSSPLLPHTDDSSRIQAYRSIP